MATREIPRAEWTRFFDQFSRDHLDETATLAVTGQDVGRQIVADTQIFRGISADEKATVCYLAPLRPEDLIAEIEDQLSFNSLPSQSQLQRRYTHALETRSEGAELLRAAKTEDDFELARRRGAEIPADVSV